MCLRKLRRLSALSGLFFLLAFSPLCSSCFGEVRLTEEEAELILSELQESRAELESARKDLIQSQKDLLEQKETLESVRSDCDEQRKSYETRLTKAEKKNDRLKTAVTITSTASAVSLVVVFLLILL